MPTEKIGLIIGPGGKNIKGMSEKTGSQINIDDDGTVTIYNHQKDGAEKAQKMVEGLVEEAVVGKVYTGPVKRIMDFGAFVEILPGKEGLVHISKLAATRVENVQRRREGRPGAHRQGHRDRPHGPHQPGHQGGPGRKPRAHDGARRTAAAAP